MSDVCDSWLHLFTSNIRELYISDAIDIVASPVGIHHRFRYEGKYISNQTRELWKRKELDGCEVVVHFSLQHAAGFHPAVFIPLRQGTVVRTLVEGNTYIVYFRLSRYLPLADRPQNSSAERAAAVQQYSTALRQLLVEANPDHAVHATTGGSPEGLVAPTDDAGRDFETLVRFLTPSVPAYQRARTYFRVTSIETESSKQVQPDENGSVPFVAGTEYVLNVAHFHHEPLTEPARISVTAPEALEVVTDQEIVIRSRYDVIPVRLFPPFRESHARGELVIRTAEPTLGPTVRIPLSIRPARSVALFAPTLGIGAASAIALPPILASGQNLVLRIVFAVLGAAAVGLGLWWRRSRGLGT
ncbi:hypothetical protein [Actinophytocola xanthii]|uniref:Uncharacterized protein n=1 Tax=Actinophytocola xanthii TaxID=1912961 RepID=A0A1Q8C1M9_9PSEU|nr:hypothetical protein [Actinophytocola xanthii]OLF08265.1 hypothetical protein BU204_34640 [Actinophytocola xanthii]